MVALGGGRFLMSEVPLYTSSDRRRTGDFLARSLALFLSRSYSLARSSLGGAEPEAELARLLLVLHLHRFHLCLCSTRHPSTVSLGLGTRWSHWLGIGAIGLVD